MPKMKSHRGAAKRFRKTGSGKIKFKHACLRHCLSSQQTSTKRALRKPGYLTEADAKHVRKMLRGDH
jgi:large subunit ribosomal protein L35